MKRYVHFLLLLVTGLSLLACYDNAPSFSEPSVKAYYLSVYKSSLDFSSDASAQDVQVESTNTPWCFEGMPTWVTFTPTVGDGSVDVSVSVTNNPSADTIRTCVVTFRSTIADYAYSRHFDITQAKAKPYVWVADTDRNITFDAAGGSKTINVETNTSYTISHNIPSWLSVIPSSDRKTLTITAEANESTKERTPHTFFLNGSVSIKVMQRAANVTVTEASTLSAEVDGSTFAIKITSDMPWTSSNNGYSWIDITPSSGEAGTTNVLLSVAPNKSTSSLTGRVTFLVGTSTACEITIVQNGMALDVKQEAVSFDADACSRSVDVECNTVWKVMSKPEWIDMPTEPFKGNKTLSMSVADYNLTTARSGEVVLGVEGVSLTKKIAVTQAGRTFDDIVSTLNFTAKPSSQTFTITTDGSWYAEASEEWVVLSKTTGKGASDITVSVKENTSDTERSAIITVGVGDTKQTLLVVQNGYYMTITPTSLTALGSTGGSRIVQIASNGQWTASKKASWLTITPANGMGDIDMTMTVADNPSVNPRSDTVVIVPQYGQGVKIVVLQNARYLNVSTNEINFFYKGGESEPVVVETDGSYKISTTDSWLTIKDNGKSFTVTATKNPLEEERVGKIKVELTGLIDGEEKLIEIPVLQNPAIVNPQIDNFSDDENWNFGANSSNATIPTKNFGNDENWDTGIGKTDFSVTVICYQEDVDWNANLEE